MQRRLYSLDLVRTVAILSVLAWHTMELLPMPDLSVLALESPLKFVVFSTINIVGRLGVPLFFFLTGYLLLSRDYNDEGQVNRFYKSSLLPLLVCWEIWVLLLSLYIGWRDGGFELINYIKCAFFLDVPGVGIGWYMPVLIGIYIFLPYLARILQRLSTVKLAVLMSLLFCFCFASTTANIFSQTGGLNIGSALLLPFGAGANGAYVFYLILGYCFQRYKVYFPRFYAKKYAKLLLSLIIIALWATFVMPLWVTYNLGSHYGLWYDFAVLPMLASAIFLLLKSFKIKARCVQVLFKNIAICSFGMFLIHQPIQQTFARMLPQGLNGAIRMLIIFVVSTLLSWAIVSLARHIKNAKVRKSLFYLK